MNLKIGLDACALAIRETPETRQNPLPVAEIDGAEASWRASPCDIKAMPIPPTSKGLATGCNLLVRRHLAGTEAIKA